jgi:5-formyltetrahydrofolate cyclo-ligase
VTKERLRAQARERLRQLGAAQRLAAGEAIAERVWELPEVERAGTILLFASLPEEVPTAPLARVVLERGHRLVYPRSHPGGRLVLHLVEEVEALAVGRYGILEPDVSLPQVEPGAVEAALAPGLAWDRQGTRLGRGGGYFDRLFGSTEWRGFICGIFFAVQEVPRIPHDPWDAPLGAVATERELWRPGPAGGGPT